VLRAGADSTLSIEDLIGELTASYTIVIVTHNTQQAACISPTATAFFNLVGVGQPGSSSTTTPDDLLHTPRKGLRGLHLRALRLTNPQTMDIRRAPTSE
jgi:hypothetical protein